MAMDNANSRPPRGRRGNGTQRDDGGYDAAKEEEDDEEEEGRRRRGSYDGTTLDDVVVEKDRVPATQQPANRTNESIDLATPMGIMMCGFVPRDRFCGAGGCGVAGARYLYSNSYIPEGTVSSQGRK